MAGMVGVPMMIGASIGAPVGAVVGAGVGAMKGAAMGKAFVGAKLFLLTKATKAAFKAIMMPVHSTIGFKTKVRIYILVFPSCLIFNIIQFLS